MWSQAGVSKGFPSETHVPCSLAGAGLGGEVPLGRIQSLQLPTFDKSSPQVVSPSVDAGKDTGSESVQTPVMGPFILSENLPVVPARLVKRILKSDYIDMAELLKDNMEVERRRALVEAGAYSSSMQARASRREMPDILSWLNCFSMYAAVVCSKYPQKAQELFAYQANMVNEARRCGGKGWLLYDATFRQQISSIEATDFSRLNPSLYSSTIVAFGKQSPCCTLCMLPDHTQEECALNPAKAVPFVQVKENAPSISRGNKEEFKKGGWQKKKPRHGACYSWNSRMGCKRPACLYEHRCARCFGDHTRLVCPLEPKQEGRSF